MVLSRSMLDNLVKRGMLRWRRYIEFTLNISGESLFFSSVFMLSVWLFSSKFLSIAIA